MELLTAILLQMWKASKKTNLSILLIGILLILSSLILKHPNLSFPTHVLTALTTSTITALLLCIVSIWKNRLDLKAFLGVYWDANGHPYCPHCKTMLVQTEQKCNEDHKIYALRYMNNHCNQNPIFLRNDNGQPIRIRLAKKFLMDKLKTKIPLDPLHD